MRFGLWLLVAALSGICVALYNQNIELKAKASSSLKADFELQERCAAQAEHQYKLLGMGRPDKDVFNSGFESHYNPRVGKCFAKTMTWLKDGSYGVDIFDAVEGASYGSYFRAQSEATPTLCSVTSPGSETKYCHSTGEFDELVKPFMER